MTCRHFIKGTRGFTLIEVILAVFAISIVLIVAQGILSNAVRLRDRSVKHVQEARERTQLARVVRSDLMNAFVSGGVLASTLVGSQQATDSSFPGYLKFTTTAGNRTSATSTVDSPEVQEVQYFIKDDPADKEHQGGVLVRVVDKNLLAPIRQPDDPEALIHHVKSLTTTFFDGSNWVNSWDNSSDESLLPLAVQVSIQLSAPEGKEEPPPVNILVPWTTQPFTNTSGTNNAVTSVTSQIHSTGGHI